MFFPMSSRLEKTEIAIHEYLRLAREKLWAPLGLSGNAVLRLLCLQMFF